MNHSKIRLAITTAWLGLFYGISEDLARHWIDRNKFDPTDIISILRKKNTMLDSCIVCGAEQDNQPKLD